MQMQRGAFSGIIRDALQLSAIGRIERVQDKPCERESSLSSPWLQSVLNAKRLCILVSLSLC